MNQYGLYNMFNVNVATILYKSTQQLDRRRISVASRIVELIRQFAA